jgi:hypothetical protein
MAETFSPDFKRLVDLTVATIGTVEQLTLHLLDGFLVHVSHLLLRN